MLIFFKIMEIQQDLDFIYSLLDSLVTKGSRLKELLRPDADCVSTGKSEAFTTVQQLFEYRNSMSSKFKGKSWLGIHATCVFGLCHLTLRKTKNMARWQRYNMLSLLESTVHFFMCIIRFPRGVFIDLLSHTRFMTLVMCRSSVSVDQHALKASVLMVHDTDPLWSREEGACR